MVIGLKVSAPIRKITAYVLGIAHGDKTARLDVHSRDDLGELADALRAMVQWQDELAADNAEKAEAERLGQQARIAHQEAVEAKQKGMAGQTADEVRAIATASEEQSAASEEITRSISEVNEITFSTSEAMQTAARGVESLRRRSQDLVTLIEDSMHTELPRPLPRRSRGSFPSGAVVSSGGGRGI